MPTLRARISIQSSPADVFRALTNFDDYQKWNPWLKNVKGEAKEGRKVIVQPQISLLSPLISNPSLAFRLKKIQTDSLFWQQEAWYNFLLNTTREYQVYTKAGGSAIYSIHLRFHGWLAPVCYVVYGRAVRRGLRKEAEALKEYCEKNLPLQPDKKLIKTPVEPLVDLDRLSI